jgi:hypothetical protein
MNLIKECGLDLFQRCESESGKRRKESGRRYTGFPSVSNPGG